MVSINKQELDKYITLRFLDRGFFFLLSAVVGLVLFIFQFLLDFFNASILSISSIISLFMFSIPFIICSILSYYCFTYKITNEDRMDYISEFEEYKLVKLIENKREKMLLEQVRNLK